MVQKQNKPMAAAILRGGEANRYILGKVQFFQKPGGVLVSVAVSGLPGDGFYGFHIHTGESCGGTGFADTLGHYDPNDMPHPMHAGDLPPLLSTGGRAYMTVLTGRFSISEVIGRSVIIHSKPDDFHTQPSGDAGEKIACGVIERM